ncbi:MAG: hypothetical protein AB1896_19570, partial [Thermodesulfobacteriota bacterium]
MGALLRTMGLVTVVVALIVPSFWWYYQESDRDQMSKLLDSALEAEKEGRLHQAALYYGQALKMDCLGPRERAKLYLSRGVVHQKLSQWDQALRD